MGGEAGEMKMGSSLSPCLWGRRQTLACTEDLPVGGRAVSLTFFHSFEYQDSLFWRTQLKKIGKYMGKCFLFVYLLAYSTKILFVCKGLKEYCCY